MAQGSQLVLLGVGSNADATRAAVFAIAYFVLFTRWRSWLLWPRCCFEEAGGQGHGTIARFFFWFVVVDAVICGRGTSYDKLVSCGAFCVFLVRI